MKKVIGKIKKTDEGIELKVSSGLDVPKSVHLKINKNGGEECQEKISTKINSGHL